MPGKPNLATILFLLFACILILGSVGVLCFQAVFSPPPELPAYAPSGSSTDFADSHAYTILATLGFIVIACLGALGEWLRYNRHPR
jgi:hypothetical protein